MRSQGVENLRGGHRLRHGILALAVVLGVFGSTALAQTSGRGRAQLEARSVASLRADAEDGDAEAAYLLAGAYTYGVGVRQDPETASRWYRLAAELGYVGAQERLRAAQNVTDAGDRAQPFVARVRQAAEHGDADNQYSLGLMYENGVGVPQDHFEAVWWFQLAAEQGHASAQHRLGLIYEDSDVVPQDHAEAVRWHRAAAEQGLAEAQYNLGVSYSFGQGTLKDEAEAVRWYRLAAEQGLAEAQYNLGVSYSFGQGTLKDEAEAMRWYRLAAEQGYAHAQHNLGVSYHYGQGTLKDPVLAHMWFNIASANGVEDAREGRDALEQDMTRAEIARATELARACMASDYQACDGER